MSAPASVRKPGLEPCLAKIERAREHLADAQRRVDAWKSLGPVGIDCQHNAESCPVYSISSIAPIPAGLGLVIADAIHNTRTALDHVVYQLFLANGGLIAKAKSLHFPTGISARHYATEANRKLVGISPAARAAIDALKPYKGGDERFVTLNALDNADKHRVLWVVAAQVLSVDLMQGHLGQILREALEKAQPGTVVELPKLAFRLADSMWPLKVGDVLFTDAPNAPIDTKYYATFQLAFGDTGICDGQGVIDIPTQLIALAESVVLGLEPYL